MARPNMTYKLAYAAAWDAGNRHAAKHGRSRWSRDDYNAAAAEFERLWPESEYGAHPARTCKVVEGKQCTPDQR